MLAAMSRCLLETCARCQALKAQTPPNLAPILHVVTALRRTVAAVGCGEYCEGVMDAHSWAVDRRLIRPDEHRQELYEVALMFGLVPTVEVWR